MKMAEGNGGSRRREGGGEEGKVGQEKPAEGLRKMKRLCADDAGNKQQNCRHSSTVLSES